MLVLRTFVQSLRHQFRFLSRLMRVNVVRLHLWQVELLGPKDGAWASDTDPANERLRRNLEVFHGPEADQSSRAPKASLAVDGDSAAVRLVKVSLDNVEELLDDAVRRRGPINKEEVVVGNVLLEEGLPVVLLLVQTDHALDADVLEDVAVLVGMVAVAVVRITLLDGSHEGDELAGNDHVQVTILDALVVLVLFHVESLEIVPSKLHSSLEALKAVEHGTVEEAVALGGIAVVLKDGRVALELLMCLLGRHLKDNDAEGAHEESSVDHFVSGVRRAAVVENAVLRVVLVAK